MEKFRLNNPNKFNVGIILPDKPVGINIAPGSFTMVTDDDIAYLMSTSRLLNDGILRLDKKKEPEIAEQMGVDVTENPSFMTNEEIQKKLNGTAKNIEKWLEDVNDPITLDRIGQIALEMNLNANKIKVLQKKIKHIDFIGE